MSELPPEPKFRYYDVSDDPTAPQRSNVTEETREALSNLGFTGWGHVYSEFTEKEACFRLSEVWCSEDRTVFADVTNTVQGDAVGFKTLLEDGTIISTERVEPNLMGLLVAHGVRPAPSTGYLWHGSHAKGVADLFADHQQALTRALSKTEAKVLELPDFGALLGVRVRYREIADRALGIQRAVGKQAKYWGYALALALLALTLLIGRPIGSNLSILLITWALTVGFTSSLVGLLFVGPMVARWRSVPPTDLEAILALGQAVPDALLPDLEPGPEPEPEPEPEPAQEPARDR